MILLLCNDVAHLNATIFLTLLISQHNKALYVLKLLVQISETRRVLFNCLSPLDIIFLLTVTNDKLSRTEREIYMGSGRSNTLRYSMLRSNENDKLYKNISERAEGS